MVNCSSSVDCMYPKTWRLFVPRLSVSCAPPFASSRPKARQSRIRKLKVDEITTKRCKRHHPSSSATSYPIIYHPRHISGEISKTLRIAAARTPGYHVDRDLHGHPVAFNMDQGERLVRYGHDQYRMLGRSTSSVSDQDRQSGRMGVYFSSPRRYLPAVPFES